MIRVLFVDDEPMVLRGLQRMLSEIDCDWQMEFVESGDEALALLAEQAFDVVVSDMRMPKMDGASLLNEVRRRYPDMVRIVLSGHSERELILRCVGATHRYLAKPCDAQDLRRTVMQAVALRQTLTNSSLRSLVSQMSRIPSAPHFYREIVNQVQAPEKSLRDLGRTISQDIGMTAKILHIVNSAFFGLPRHVSDPVHATCLLGFDVMRALVMTAHIFTELGNHGTDDLGIDSLWNHSTQTGAIARNIATAEGRDPQECDHAFMAGLLHDTGKLILAVNLPGQYREMVALSTEKGVAPLAAERHVFGATHAEVGAYLLGLWGLPDPTVEAVAFHHRPGECLAATFAPVTAVHVADALQHEQHGTPGELQAGQLDPDYLERLKLTERLPVWREQCVPETDR